MDKIVLEENKPILSKRKTGLFIVVFLILSFIMGLLGGVGGILILSSSPLKDFLGLSNIKEISLPTVKTDKVVLEESSAIIDAAKKVSPSVVNITFKKNMQDFFGRVTTAEGGGTGFIITNDGLILTNKHVISDATVEYMVLTSDGKSFPAQVLSQDPFNDLAVIKIDAKGLSAVELGDSSAEKLQIGQWVVAIGNALGEFQNTVTVGVVSARERTLTASEPTGASVENLEGLIQTDAAINAGNSGGPLLNLKGQVIGINTAVASKQVAEGIGFAIPINTAKPAIESVKKTGRIIRPFLGIRYIPIDKEIAQQANLPVDYGVLVKTGSNRAEAAVVADSPADKAGIKDGDIITYVNGEKIDSNHS
ncbi:MAG: hypothetical protein COU44_03510, partial [Candidatus Nealsonbacteria bacterium CG10_big_fil_rev_8_21_14_0_10_40_24]